MSLPLMMENELVLMLIFYVPLLIGFFLGMIVTFFAVVLGIFLGVLKKKKTKREVKNKNITKP